MKRILAMILAFGLFAALTPNFSVYAEEYVYASLEPGVEYKLHNIKSFYFGASDGTSLVEREGRTGVQFHYLEPKTAFLYINVDDDVIYTPEGTSAKVYVDYFDEGNASFTLRYCSVDQQWNDDTEVVFCEDTKTWKTHEFVIKDATFNNRCNNADIVVAQWSNQLSRSSEDIIIGRVRIEKFDNPVMVSVESDEYGNIFAPDENMLLKLNIKNKTNKEIPAKLEYGIYDHYDELLENKSEDVKIAKDGGTIEVKPEIDKFGTYTIKGTLSYTEDGREYKEDINAMFSLADKFKDGEAKNERLGVCSHWHMFVAKDFMEQHHTTLAEMGASWDRSEIQWSLIEKEKGQFSFPVHASTPMSLKEHDLNTLMILDYGNVLYSNGAGENSMPNTPEYIEAFKKYCVATAEKYKGTVEYFELWNEVNNTVFNEQGLGIDVYANLVKEVVPAIKAVDPNIKIIGPVTINVAADWYRELFSYGTYDYFDCLSTHPYQWNRDLEKDALRKEVNELRTVMSEYGEPKPIWISEIGWSTGKKATWGVDPKERPRMALQAYAIMIGEKLADKVFWYNFHNKGNNKYESTYNLGLIEHQTASVTPFAAHDEYIMFTAMNRLIGQADPAEYIRREDDTMLYHFKRYDGDDVILTWSEAESKAVGMNLGCQTLEKYDMYGNKLATLKSPSGIFTLSAERMPVYYKGVFNSFEETTADVTAECENDSVGIGEEFDFKVSDAHGRKISMEVNTELEVVKNDGGTLTLKVPADKTGSYEYEVTAYADGEICYTGKNTVTVNALETSLEMIPVTDSFFKAKLTLKNMTNYTPISGTAELSIEESDEKPNRPIRFVEIKPGQSRTFEIGMPEITKARAKTVKTELVTNAGFKYETKQQFDFLVAKHANKKPVIDGNISPGEWSGLWFAADQKSNVKQIVKWNGATDSSFFGNLMWDEENLYMAISATDNIFCQPYTESSVWQGDGLQFAFSDNALVKENTSQCTAFAAARTSAGNQLFRSTSDYKGERGLLENAEFSTSLSQGKIIYEMAIPWSEIFYDGFVPELGNSVDFTILMNDNDGTGRRGWLEYGSGLGTGRNYKLFSKLNFVK